jgi:quercetin dioxygenase-like cupin family protein
MKKLFILFGIAAAVAIVAPFGIAQEKAEKSKKPAAGVKAKELVYASSANATYQERMPGVSMAVVWGDPDKGRYGLFTKFTPGYDAKMHTHTNDVWLVVLKGAYLYKDEAGDKHVGPGEFIRIPGGHKHWSGGDPTEGALFYSEGSGKFDKIDVKQ